MFTKIEIPKTTWVPSSNSDNSIVVFIAKSETNMEVLDKICFWDQNYLKIVTEETLLWENYYNNNNSFHTATSIKFIQWVEKHHNNSNNIVVI